MSIVQGNEGGGKDLPGALVTPSILGMGGPVLIMLDMGVCSKGGKAGQLHSWEVGLCTLSLSFLNVSTSARLKQHSSPCWRVTIAHPWSLSDLRIPQWLHGCHHCLHLQEKLPWGSFPGNLLGISPTPSQGCLLGGWDTESCMLNPGSVTPQRTPKQQPVGMCFLIS